MHFLSVNDGVNTKVNDANVTCLQHKFFGKSERTEIKRQVFILRV